MRWASLSEYRQQTREHQRLVFSSREPTQWTMATFFGRLAIAQDNLAFGGAGGVDQALDLEGIIDIGVNAVAEEGGPFGVKDLEPGGHDDRADRDVLDFLGLLEVDRFAVAAGLDAGFLAFVGDRVCAVRDSCRA